MVSTLGHALQALGETVPCTRTCKSRVAATTSGGRYPVIALSRLQPAWTLTGDAALTGEILTDSRMPIQANSMSRPQGSSCPASRRGRSGCHLASGCPTRPSGA